MKVLSYGYKYPEDGDFGSTFYPLIAYNFNRVNSHNHDGINSPSLPVTAYTIATQEISADDWVATSGGMYRQLVTMAAAMTWAGRQVNFRDTDTGIILYLYAEQVGVNTYYLYTNDNTLNVTAVYT